MPLYRFLMTGALAALATPAIANEPMVHTVIRFVKDKPTSSPVAVFQPESCPACIDGKDPDFAHDNGRETLVDLHVPAGRTLELAFAAPRGGVRRVTLETTDLPFRQEGGRLLVNLPPLQTDMVDTGEFSTHIVEPGMVLRFEHADPARLAGDYAGKPLPATQRAAADNLEFAQREAIRETGLGQYVAREGLGVIEVMGFDTNDPHGHRDSPPHMHMHLRWPYNTGTQIGHYYLSPAGLLTQSHVGITGYHLPSRTFGPGQTFTTMDDHGRPVYAHTITPEGWLTLAAVWPGHAPQTCLLKPAGSGFQSGVIVACDGHDAVTVDVKDDLVAGIIRVSTGPIIETFRYDRDDGLLLSPQAAPSVPASVLVPISRTEFPLPAAGIDPLPPSNHD